MDEELIKKKYVKVDRSDTVSKLIGKLKTEKAKSALIFNEDEFLGVVDAMHLVRSKLDPSEMKVHSVLKHVPVLRGDEDIKEAARLLYTAKTRALPVLHKGKVEGVVDAMDLIMKLQEREDAKKEISNFMTKKLVTIKEDQSVGQAISLMKQNNITRIPVIDDSGNLINIVSLLDFLFDFAVNLQHRTERRGRSESSQKGPMQHRAFSQRTDLNQFPITSLTPVITVTAEPSDTLSRTIDKLERFDISSIIVVEGKEPVGLVTIRDLLKLFLKDEVTI